MADNFFNDKPEAPAEDAPQTIKVGDVEYKPEELTTLVEKGKQAKEIEEKQNTRIDRVFPEYTKSQQRLKEVESELAELRRKSETPSSLELTPEQKELAKKQLYELLGGKVLTESEARNIVREERAGEKLIDECRGLEKEINGDDGRPRFETQKILEHMNDTGIKNPVKAYKDLYESELDVWKEKQLSSDRPDNPTLEKSRSQKQPKVEPTTKGNLNERVREALWGAREE